MRLHPRFEGKDFEMSRTKRLTNLVPLLSFLFCLIIIKRTSRWISPLERTDDETRPIKSVFFDRTRYNFLRAPNRLTLLSAERSCKSMMSRHGWCPPELSLCTLLRRPISGDSRIHRYLYCWKERAILKTVCDEQCRHNLVEENVYDSKTSSSTIIAE